MASDGTYDPMMDDDYARYKDEAVSRWGGTAAYRQSMARVKKMTKAQMEAVKREGGEIIQAIADRMDKEIADPEVQELIEKHHRHIGIFYDCPPDIYRNLGKMYVDDRRFAAFYEKFRPGLAVFISDAISYYCNHRV